MQLFFAIRAALLIQLWNAGLSFASSLQASGTALKMESDSLSLSASIATAGVPITFFISSADAQSIVCVQVLNSSLHTLNSFVGSNEFSGSFSVDAATRLKVVGYKLRNGGLNFSSSSVSFGTFHEGLVSTTKHVRLTPDELLPPFVQWVGMFKGPCTGNFVLNVTSSHAYALRINSTLLIDNLSLRVFGVSSTVFPLHLVENSFSDIEVSAHVIACGAGTLVFSPVCDATPCAGAVLWKFYVAVDGTLLRIQ